MKLVMILVGMSALAANAQVLKANGVSEQRAIAIGLKGAAIKDAKEKLVTECLKGHTAETCDHMKFEVNMTRVTTHRECGGTIFGPEGHCSIAEAEVWGRL